MSESIELEIRRVDSNEMIARYSGMCWCDWEEGCDSGAWGDQGAQRDQRQGEQATRLVTDTFKVGDYFTFEL